MIQFGIIYLLLTAYFPPHSLGKASSTVAATVILTSPRAVGLILIVWTFLSSDVTHELRTPA